MTVSNPRRWSRRHLLQVTAVAGGTFFFSQDRLALAGPQVINCPFVPQGDTGSESNSNCGPATCAAAISFSQLAYPSARELRNLLGTRGGTNLGQWAWLLDYFGVPWYKTGTRQELNGALAAGHVVVMAAWMANLSAGSDFETPNMPKKAYVGRYDAFREGHAMLIVGTADGGENFLIHDPNVFPSEPNGYYKDGSPKGAYRRYNAAEIWGTIANYAGGVGLAVPPPTDSGYTSNGESFIAGSGESENGPGGGHKPRRGSQDLGAAAAMGTTSAITHEDDEDPDDPFKNTNG